MSSPLYRRRVVAWIAWFAIVLNALAPTISTALTAERGSSGWTQLCTLAGMRWVQIDDLAVSQDPGAPEQRALDSAPCPFCSSHASPPVILSAPLEVVVVLSRAHAPTPRLLLSPRPSADWTIAPSRAPPRLA